MNTIFPALVNREIIKDVRIVKLIGIVFFVAATALGAFIKVPLPFTPVPLTLQTFFVLLSGLVLGSRTGMFAQFSYLVLGGIGLPLFTGSAALWGPTGGYIAGFVFAAYTVGCLHEKGVRLPVAVAAGTAAIYLFGAVWLSVFVGGLKNAFLFGVLPFVAGDLLKIFAALGAFNIYKNFRR